jgi:hypothetical protein
MSASGSIVSDTQYNGPMSSSSMMMMSIASTTAQQQQQQQQQHQFLMATFGNHSDADAMALPSLTMAAAAASASNENTTTTTTTTPADSMMNPKRTLLTHGKDGQQLSEKKLRRLEKNRLSARECRRRKREATEHLQHEINALEAENLKLRLQLQIGQEAESCNLLEQTRVVTQDIQNLLASGASEADIFATLEEFKEKYADYGKSRRSGIEFHLRQIERLLKPTQTTSIVMHAIQGGGAAAAAAAAATATEIITTTKAPKDPSSLLLPISHNSHTTVASTASLQSVLSHNEDTHLLVAPSTSTSTTPSPLVMNTTAATTHSSSSIFPPAPLPLPAASAAKQQQQLDPKALFQYLVNYLEVTPQQAAAMKDSRFVARELDGILDSSLRVLYELRRRLAETGEDLEAEFANVRSILTPTQAARFLVWVANNAACVHMLNELWDRVYPSTTTTTMTTTTTYNDNNDDDDSVPPPAPNGN